MYVKSYYGQTKWMYSSNDDLLKTYNTIRDKVTVDTKN